MLLPSGCDGSYNSPHAINTDPVVLWVGHGIEHNLYAASALFQTTSMKNIQTCISAVLIASALLRAASNCARRA